MKKPLCMMLLLGLSRQGWSQEIFDLSFERNKMEVVRSEKEDKIFKVLLKKKDISPIPKGHSISVQVDAAQSTLPAAEYQIDFGVVEIADLHAENNVYITVFKDNIPDRPRKLVLVMTVNGSGGHNVGENRALEISVIPAKSLPDKDTVYTLSDYLEKHKLYEVVNVVSNHDVLTLYGYQDLQPDFLSTKKIRLKRNQVYQVWSQKWITLYSHLSLSLMTTPFKVRPQTEGFPRTAISGLSNLGLNFSVYDKILNNYFIDGHKSTHKFSLGLWIAPAVEELNAKTTEGSLINDETSRQLFLSIGSSITYSYNNITFSIIPMGYDIATSTIGKSWVYNKKRWWGFGIGLDPKIFSTILNR